MDLYGQIDAKLLDADKSLKRAGERIGEALNKYSEARAWTDTLLIAGGMLLGALAFLGATLAFALLILTLDPTVVR